MSMKDEEILKDEAFKAEITAKAQELCNDLFNWSDGSYRKIASTLATAWISFASTVNLELAGESLGALVAQHARMTEAVAIDRTMSATKIAGMIQSLGRTPARKEDIN